MDDIVAFEPKTLQFNIKLLEQTYTNLTLRNISDSRLAFKVKTTCVQRYSVRPSCRVVEPGEQVTVLFGQKSFSEPPEDLDDCRDRFQLLVVPLDSFIKLRTDIDDGNQPESTLKIDDPLLGFSSAAQLWSAIPNNIVYRQKLPVILNLISDVHDTYSPAEVNNATNNDVHDASPIEVTNATNNDVHDAYSPSEVNNAVNNDIYDAYSHTELNNAVDNAQEAGKKAVPVVEDGLFSVVQATTEAKHNLFESVNINQDDDRNEVTEIIDGNSVINEANDPVEDRNITMNIEESVPPILPDINVDVANNGITEIVDEEDEQEEEIITKVTEITEITDEHEQIEKIEEQVNDEIEKTRKPSMFEAVGAAMASAANISRDVKSNIFTPSKSEEISDVTEQQAEISTTMESEDTDFNIAEATMTPEVETRGMEMDEQPRFSTPDPTNTFNSITKTATTTISDNISTENPVQVAKQVVDSIKDAFPTAIPQSHDINLPPPPLPPKPEFSNDRPPLPPKSRNLPDLPNVPSVPAVTMSPQHTEIKIRSEPVQQSPSIPTTTATVTNPEVEVLLDTKPSLEKVSSLPSSTTTTIRAQTKPATATSMLEKEKEAIKKKEVDIDYSSADYVREREIHMNVTHETSIPAMDELTRHRVAVERAGELSRVIEGKLKCILDVQEQLVEARHRLSDARMATRPAYDVKFEVSESSRVPIAQICIMAIISGALIQLLI